MHDKAGYSLSLLSVLSEWKCTIFLLNTYLNPNEVLYFCQLMENDFFQYTRSSAALDGMTGGVGKEVQGVFAIEGGQVR